MKLDKFCRVVMIKYPDGKTSVFSCTNQSRAEEIVVNAIQSTDRDLEIKFFHNAIHSDN